MARGSGDLKLHKNPPERELGGENPSPEKSPEPLEGLQEVSLGWGLRHHRLFVFFFEGSHEAMGSSVKKVRGPGNPKGIWDFCGASSL